MKLLHPALNTTYPRLDVFTWHLRKTRNERVLKLYRIQAGIPLNSGWLCPSKLKVCRPASEQRIPRLNHDGQNLNVVGEKLEYNALQALEDTHGLLSKMKMHFIAKR